jgi:hypothetical protein
VAHFGGVFQLPFGSMEGLFLTSERGDVPFEEFSLFSQRFRVNRPFVLGLSERYVHFFLCHNTHIFAGVSPPFLVQSYGRFSCGTNLCKHCKDLEMRKISVIEKESTTANLCKPCNDLQRGFSVANFAIRYGGVMRRLQKSFMRSQLLVRILPPLLTELLKLCRKNGKMFSNLFG